MPESWLDLMEHSFEEVLADLVPDGTSEEETAGLVEAALREAQARIADLISQDLQRRTPETLAAEREATTGFEARTFERWRPAFDLYEKLLLILTEVGGEHDSTLRPVAAQSSDWKFEAISHLHARALLVGQEIYALLRAGYPDGALARWRSLHENAVIAMFLSQNDNHVAFRYLAGFHRRAYAAALELNEHASRANLTPFRAEELRELKRNAEAAAVQAGQHPLKKDYDWALPGLAGQPATFKQIELATGMEHWRPRYRWACQHNHGGHRPWMSMLGMSESQSAVALVGASNSGFVDPLHMSAISLLNVFATFMLLEPNLDRLVLIQIVTQIVDELGDTALRVEAETLAAARKTRVDHIEGGGKQ